MQNASDNKVLNYIVKNQSIRMVTPRVVQTSPLLSFGASTKKEDIAKARALRFEDNEKAREILRQEIHERQKNL